MLLEFDTIEETVHQNFKGGEKTFSHSVYGDDLNRIMRGRLLSGASIGAHCHETSSEIIYILSGTATVICDGTEETVSAGQCHYCPKGSTHTMKNNGTEELVFFAVVPQQ